MENAKVPIPAQRMGRHYDAAFTMRTYVHVTDDDLMAGTNFLS